MNVAIPITETVYDDTALTVKVRKQIDETNWDEATSFSDSLGRTFKTVAKDSQGDVIVETKYDNLGRVKATSNPYRSGDAVYWSKPRYDELNRVVETFAPALENQTGASLGITEWGISTVPDFVGTYTIATDASGRKARSITNALGQLIRIDEPTGNNDLGSIATPNQPTFYKYNPQGKMVHVQQGKTGEPAIQHRYFLYDFLGRLIRVKQPEQEVNTALNILDPVTNNSVWTAAMEYDLVGNLKKTIDAKGTTITNDYDKAGRVKTRNYSNEPAGINTPAVQYFYDGKGLTTPQTPNYAKGKLTKVTSSISETRYNSFDNFGRLLQMEQRTPFETETIANATPRISSYQYDFGGRLVAETYPSGRVVKNEFEPDGDLQRIASKANANAIEKTYANGFSFTASGGFEKMRLGNGKFETAKFNNRLQITELGLGSSASDASLWKVNYEYGELENGSVNINKNTGNIARQTLNFAGLTNPIVQSYKYDSLDRIIDARETSGTAVNAPENWNQTWNYDRFGNRIAFSQNVNGQQLAINSGTLPSVNPNTNRFNPGQGFAYDKNGNIVSDAVNNGRSFEFNGDNKQTKVFNSSGGEVGKYFYDGEGARVKKVVGNETTIFVYSSGKLIAEYSNATPTATPTTSYTTTDHLGSPRVITDATGQVKSRRDFMPFGEEIGLNTAQTPNRASVPQYGASDNVRQKFTGYLKDNETNLDYAEARYYNNQHGRFTAVDPLLASGKSANPQTFNRFVYVGNSPLMRIDATGLIWGIAGKHVRWFKNERALTKAGYETFRPDNWTYQGEGNVTVRLNPTKNSFRTISNAVPGDKGYREIKDQELPAGSRAFLVSLADNTQKQGKIVIVGVGGAFLIGSGIGAVAGATGALSGAGLTTLKLGAPVVAQYAAANPNQTIRTLEVASDKGSYIIYQAIDKATGAVRYVGITSRDLIVRAGEHAAEDVNKANLRFQEIGTAADKLSARIAEQTKINELGGKSAMQAGRLLNQINSVAEKYWQQYNIPPPVPIP